MKKHFVALITFAGGAFFLLEFLLPERAPDWILRAAAGRLPAGAVSWLANYRNPLTGYLGLAMDIIVVLTTMALLLGPLNLVIGHGMTVFRQRRGWLESIVFLIFLAGSLVIASRKELSGAAFDQQLYDRLFELLNAFGKTSMALLAFYLVSAAYRSFRLQSLDSAVMLISAVVLLLGLVPLGAWFTHRLPEWAQLPTAARWVLATPNTAVQRAVAFGACAGAFAAGLRHWLSIGTKAA